MHVWSRAEDVPDIRIGGAANVSDLPVPVLRQSMDVNALNFCRFSLLESTGDGNSGGGALIALPNLVESSLVSHCDDDTSATGVCADVVCAFHKADIWSLPSGERVHAAIGMLPGMRKSPFSTVEEKSKTGKVLLRVRGYDG